MLWWIIYYFFVVWILKIFLISILKGWQSISRTDNIICSEVAKTLNNSQQSNLFRKSNKLHLLFKNIRPASLCPIGRTSCEHAKERGMTTLLTLPGALFDTIRTILFPSALIYQKWCWKDTVKQTVNPLVSRCCIAFGVYGKWNRIQWRECCEGKSNIWMK